jgi:hypothetical protein
MAVIKRNKKVSKGYVSNNAVTSKYFNTKKEADSYFKKK